MPRYPKYLFTRDFGRMGRSFAATVATGLWAHFVIEHVGVISPTGGPSMLPTIEAWGDWVYISKWYRRGRGIEVGDVVSCHSIMDPGGAIIKRVIGMQGDYVLRDTPGVSDTMLQIPPGHCWIVGDNFPDSRDSRHFGPIPMALIKGKVVAKVFPWSERKSIITGLQPLERNL